MQRCFCGSRWKHQAADKHSDSCYNKCYRQASTVSQACREKPDYSQDPQLSAAGMQRAQALAEQLASVALSQLIASDYQRTQLTLAPLAKEKALTLTVASTKSGISAHIKHIVALVKQEQGNSLIAGHSNTLPLIISALGGPNIGTISESSYGGIYQLQLKQNGKVILTQSHFGQ
ncbi:histidine phosphatase family protein [Shewanella halifaxensis]|uniref:histidine phosphatase family protein n=1 Tax=Shewanella halifaxensis TaxID=271098 RepID=UPI0023517A4E|nr:histidine phosphatase family protein [Shewanella halifaxensis]